MKYLRRLFFVLVVLLVIAIVVAVTCPADFAYRFVGDRLGAVKLSGISGSIWDGHASSVQVFGTPLGALDWQLQAAPLLHGIAAAHLTLSGGEITGAADAASSPGDAIDISNATVHAPAQVAAPALDIPALQLLGDLDIDIAHAHLRSAWPESANGTAHWRNAAVSGAAQAQLGDLEATFASAADGAIKGTVHDLGGPLQLDGTFRVNAGSYDADATLRARDGNAQVSEALRYIGEPQADGSSHLVIHGELFKIF
jgi:general secretion pathway protein N